MLGAIERVRVDFKRYLSFIFIVILCAPQCARADAPPRQLYFQHEYYQRFMEYFNNLQEDADIDEVIDSLIVLRQSMLSQGYSCPTLREICHNLVKMLMGRNIEFDAPVIQELINRIEQRESALSHSYARGQIELVKHKHKHKHKHDKKEKELRMGSRGVFGFVKMVGGGLMCLVPVPGAQALGITLIGYGLNDMIDDAREQGEEAADRQRDETALMGPATP